MGSGLPGLGLSPKFDHFYFLKASLILIYCFCQFLTYDQVINETSEIPEGDYYPESGEPFIALALKKLGRATVAHYFTQFRASICAWCLKNHAGKKIGGPGKFVEKDESKFGKRKYGRFRSRRNVWILGI